MPTHLSRVRRQLDLGLPVLVGGGAAGRDHEGRRAMLGDPEASGGVDHAVHLYPEVVGPAALQRHRLITAAILKNHCRDTGEREREEIEEDETERKRSWGSQGTFRKT